MWKFFKKKKKKIMSGNEIFYLPNVIDVLNDKQILRAFKFYHDRTDFVHRIMDETDKAYEPSEAYDKVDPSIWKPEYWRWFLAYYTK